MFPAILGLIVVTTAAVMLAVLSVSRRLRRVRRAPGAAVVPPVRPHPAGGMAVPATRMTEPYAYDNGVLTGRPDEEPPPP
jgi:hypothetical protein